MTVKETQPSKGTRPYRAGWVQAESLSEIGNILYLLDNRKQFLQGIYDRIKMELEKTEFG